LPYQSDVFLSYRRWGEWPIWIDRHFLPLLSHWLGEELGRRPSIFVDTKTIEVGDIWPNELATGLATAKVLVCLWSRSYFDSNWCVAELSHMLHRQDEAGGGRLIVPATIHDGDRIPRSLSYLQTLRLNDVSNPRMTRDSAASEKLSDALREFAVPLASAVEAAPPFRREWHGAATRTVHAALDGTIRTEPIRLPQLRA